MSAKKRQPLLARIRNGLRRKATDQSGQTLTEYVLILAIVFMIAVKMKEKINDKVEASLGIVDREMAKFE